MARSFDGQDDYISIPDNAALTLPGGDWTVAFWAYFNALDGSQTYVMSWGVVGSTPSLTVIQDSQNRFYGRNVNDNGDDTASILSAIPDDEEWIHYILERSGTNITLYTNGTQTQQKDISGWQSPSATTNDSDPLILGARATLQAFWAGALQDFAKWNRTLTSQEKSDLADPDSGVRARHLTSSRSFLYELDDEGTTITEYAGGQAGSATGGAKVSGPAFTSPNDDPVVEITSPPQNITIPAGTKIVLSATAENTAEGDISDTLEWTSSNTDDGSSGLLGSGDDLTVDTTDWDTGARTITATATGYDAATGFDTVTITIGAPTGGVIIVEDDLDGVIQTNVTTTVGIRLRNSAGAILKTNALAPGDVKISVDDGTPANLADNDNAASWSVVNGYHLIPISDAEATGDKITLYWEDQDDTAYLPGNAEFLVAEYDPRAAPATKAEIATEVVGKAVSEPTGVFSWASATVGDILGWLGALGRNKVTQSATTTTLRNAADDADLATSTVSDDGTTFTRGAFSDAA